MRKNSARIFLSFALVALAVVSGCKKERHENEVLVDGLNATINYKGWNFTDDEKFIGRAKSTAAEVDKTGFIKANIDSLGIQFILFKHPVGTPVEFNSNINFLVDGTAGNVSLQDYINGSKIQFGIYLKDGKVLTDRIEKVNGIECGFMEVSGKQTIGYKEFDLRFYIMATKKGDKFFVFTGTTLDSDYESDKPLIESVFYSLKPTD